MSTPRRGAGVGARPAVRALLVVLTALVTVLTAASPAAAHPSLVSSEPGAGYAVTQPPAAVVLRFSQPVTPLSQALVVTDRNGNAVPMTVTVQDDGATLRGVPGVRLPAGGYTARYTVVALDGDVVTGTVPFGVATPVTAGRSALVQDDPDRVQPGTGMLRALLFLGLSLALGGLAAAGNTARVTGGLPSVRPLVRSGALLGLLGAGGLLLQVVPGALRDLPAVAGTPGVGRLLLAELALLAVAAALPRLAGGLPAGLALLAVVLLEGARAHPREALGSAGVALTVVHLAAAAVWAGGLVHTLRVAVHWRGKHRAARVAVLAYARLAVTAVAVLLTTGTLNALLLLPSPRDWTATTYGRVLLAKLAVLTAVLVLAVVGRRRLRASADKAADRAADKAADRAAHMPAQVQAGPPALLGGSARVEAGLLAGVLVLTAALTSATPARLASATSLLTAPSGPVLRTAERASQITVAAVISQDRLELRTYVPDSARPAAYRLTATTTSPGISTTQVDLSGCGEGCWISDTARWRDGANRLVVDVAAAGWTGGQVAFHLTWPVTPAPDLLTRVQKAMGAQGAIDSRETVTSGFGTPPPFRSRRTGQEYLQSQPWAEGGATDPVVTTTGDARTLRFALPALAYHFAFRLDQQDRIVSEHVVTGNHVLDRTYDYPAASTPARP